MKTRKPMESIFYGRYKMTFRFCLTEILCCVEWFSLGMLFETNFFGKKEEDCILKALMWIDGRNNERL